MNISIPCSETETSVSGKRSWKRVNVTRELVQGQEAATQLKLLLQKPFGADSSLSVEELVSNVVRSFEKSLSALTSYSSPSYEDDENGGDVAQKNLMNSGENGSPPVTAAGDEDSRESTKRSLQAKKDGRGSYKRRKTAGTWATVSHTAEDNHAWRKYGQKKILNSKFVRSYFRCTRKYGEGCRAIKQVQQTQENPDMYHITYIGNHTCKAISKSPHLVIHSSNLESFIVNSHLIVDSKVPKELDNHHPITLPSLVNIKQEHPKQDAPRDVTDHKLELEPNLWSDLKDVEPFNLASMPLKMASDNADAVHDSCTGYQSLEMDFVVDSVDFGTDLINFDHEISQLF